MEQRQQEWEKETTRKWKSDDKTRLEAKIRKMGPQGEFDPYEEWDKLMRKLNYNFSHVTTRADRQKHILAEIIEIQGENESQLTRLENRGPILEPNGQICNYTM